MEWSPESTVEPSSYAFSGQCQIIGMSICGVAHDLGLDALALASILGRPSPVPPMREGSTPEARPGGDGAPLGGPEGASTGGPEGKAASDLRNPNDGVSAMVWVPSLVLLGLLTWRWLRRGALIRFPRKDGVPW
jgi:hypothetical protein